MFDSGSSVLPMPAPVKGLSNTAGDTKFGELLAKLSRFVPLDDADMDAIRNWPATERACARKARSNIAADGSP